MDSREAVWMEKTYWRCARILERSNQSILVMFLRTGCLLDWTQYVLANTNFCTDIDYPSDQCLPLLKCWNCSNHGWQPIRGTTVFDSYLTCGYCCYFLLYSLTQIHATEIFLNIDTLGRHYSVQEVLCILVALWATWWHSNFLSANTNVFSC